MNLFADIHSPEQKLRDPLLERYGIELIVKREDLLHPLVSGNKFRKLKYNLQEASSQGFKTLLSFGGAYSNHIYALAAAGKMAGFRTIGFVRGEEMLPLNPTLSFAASCGMELHYIDRTSYRLRGEQGFIQEIKERYPHAWYVPEGGSNQQGVKGCKEIISDTGLDFDYICTAVGSGGTMAGLISGLQGRSRVLGFSALKGKDILNDSVRNLVGSENAFEDSWEINYEYHFGGYAKINKALIEFIINFESKFGIKLEPVYTGKMFFGLFDLIQKGYFQKGTRIVALHTGGLQGLEGLRKKIEKILQQNSVL